VDGEYCSGYYPRSISYTAWKGGFNVALLPGSHNFELLIREEDNSVKLLSFTLDGGAAYKFRKEEGSKPLVFKKTSAGDKQVDIKLTTLTPYKEPDVPASHGTIVQNKETGKQGFFAIIRVDGMPGTYGSPLGPSIYQVAIGEDYELRLTPGKHVIDYKFQITNSEKIGKDIALAEIDFVTIK